jgi:chaperonin cofactor prefoldin
MRLKAKRLKKSVPHKDYFASFDVFVEKLRDTMWEHITKSVQDLENRIATLEAQNEDLANQNKDLQVRLDALKTHDVS